MINWKKENDEIPEPGKRIAIHLPDGRVCSGMVTPTGGFNLEYVDSIDLLSYMISDKEWTYIDE